MRIKLTLIFVLILISGCTKVTQEQTDIAQAEADKAMLVVKDWYDLLASGEHEAATGLFDKKALSVTTPEVLLGVLRDFDAQHGPVVEYALQKISYKIWEARIGAKEEGQIISLTLDVGREKSQTIEYFDLIKLPGSDTYRILYYEVG